MKTIRFGSGKLIGIWPDELSPETGSAAVKAAWAIVDPERVSSAPGIVDSYDALARQINADSHLSDAGKQERRREAARNRLHQLKQHADRVKELEALHGREVAALVEVKPAEPADAVIDIALAQAYKEQAPIPTILEGWSVRAREALARLPPELTGMDEALRERIALTLAPAQAAGEALQTGQAVRVAREVVQKAINELQSVAQVEVAVLVSWFGGAGFKLAGVIDTLQALRNAEAQAMQTAAA